MLIIAAVSGFLTFLVTLWIFTQNFNSRMLLIEDKSQSVSNKVTSGIIFYSGKSLEKIGFPYEDFQGKIDTFRSHLCIIIYDIKIMSDKLVNTVYEVINRENIYGLATYTIEPVTNIITTFFSYGMDIESHLTAIHLEWWWFYGVFASLCVLFVLLSQREALLVSCAEDSEHNHIPGTVSSDPGPATSDHNSASYMRVLAGPIPQFPETRMRETDTDIIKIIYRKVFTILEESSYLSKKPHCMSRYTVTETPRISDIVQMIEPLSEFINEGIHNTTMLSQEYMNQNAKLLRAEDRLRAVERYRRAQEISALMSEKDIKIAELKIQISQLQVEINNHFDNTSQLSSQMNILQKQIEEQGRINDNIVKVYSTKLNEAKSVEDFIGDELQVETELSKSLKEEYTKIMKILMRMLIGSSKIGAISFQSIEKFLSSNQFEEFLRIGTLPAELEPEALFDGFPHLANAYEEHLNVLKDCF